ncbi:SDR family NAD(P)-dependent oxidoreductase [Rhodococcus sp. KBS0724]|uniref:SDR family oxidoreductase n=1 Tax=Rhodococcus sp. KBS0724 TaxID=1179674 RepID=UPI00110D37AD|nr:SDR family oxidoreductase [Rhodococcus sp. KBS0724]TSD40327.1 SDR family NAD(P)-dependent oxidoreductase [Rhodococcus sp. KBS0724]
MATLVGRTAIVTGGGRGLGREHALLLAKLGANVVVNDNGAASDGSADSATPADEVVAEISARGGNAIAHVGSVSNWDQADEMVQLAVGHFGGLDILVNNAGILRDRMLVNMSESEWDSVMDVHLKGHFCPLRSAANHWRREAKAGNTVAGSVINTSSPSGLRGNPGQLNYAAAKAGIAAMTVIAARELERYGVRVNAIAPVARTRLTLSTPGFAELDAATSGFDVFDPGNISPLVAYLATANCQISGQVFSVKGGHIGWERGWTEQSAYDKDSRWTVDELATALSEIPSGAPAYESSLQN